MPTTPSRARRPIVALLAAGLAIASVGTALAASGTPPWKAPPFSAIGVETIGLDASQRSLDHPTELVAFVETESSNSRCLATLNELDGPLPRALFCAPRNPTIDGVNPIEGIWLHVFFDEEVPDEFFLSVNLYQEGAKSYGSPVRCGSAEGC
jgi:hypothetical protein